MDIQPSTLLFDPYLSPINWYGDMVSELITNFITSYPLHVADGKGYDSGQFGSISFVLQTSCGSDGMIMTSRGIRMHLQVASADLFVLKITWPSG